MNTKYYKIDILGYKRMHTVLCSHKHTHSYTYLFYAHRYRNTSIKAGGLVFQLKHNYFTFAHIIWYILIELHELFKHTMLCAYSYLNLLGMQTYSHIDHLYAHVFREESHLTTYSYAYGYTLVHACRFSSLYTHK